MMANADKRPHVEQVHMDEAMEKILDMLRRRLRRRGSYGFISRHEIFGIVAEEFDELLEALRDDKDRSRFESELVDVAVSCLFGLASLTASQEQIASDRRRDG